MLTVHGHEIDFDITSPADMQRYLDAQAAMEAAAMNAPPSPAADTLATREGLEAYVAYMQGQCRLLTDFIDAAFGDGVCNALLGPRTSLTVLLDLCGDIRQAIEAQSDEAAAKFAAYLPNRATRGGGA